MPSLGRRKRDLAFHFERRSRNWQNLPEIEPSSFPEFAQRMVPFCRGTEKSMTSNKDHLPANGIWWKLEDGDTCPECKGQRLNEISRNIVLYGPQGIRLSLPEVLALNPSGIFPFSRAKVEKQQKPILHAILPGILERPALWKKSDNYLSMDRETSSLSGEAQRIRSVINSAQTYLACSRPRRTFHRSPSGR